MSFLKFSGKRQGEENSRCFVLKIFNKVAYQKEVLEHIINLILHCDSKCSNYFAVQNPIPSLNSTDGNIKYISSHDIPILVNASYDNCTKENLIINGILKVGTTGEVTCSHNIRLLTYLEGKAPNFYEEKVTDEFARDWGVTSGRLCNALEVSSFKNT